MVLLKNEDNLLPLFPKVTVAVIGHHTVNPSIGSGSSAKVLAQHIVSPVEGLQARDIDCLNSLERIQYFWLIGRSHYPKSVNILQLLPR
jgi:hypothetical protein